MGSDAGRDREAAVGNRAVLGAGLSLAAVVALVVAVVWLVPGRSPARCPSNTGNESNRMVRVATEGEIVEIELSSTVPFPTRALRPVLRIGSQEFLLSRNPDDGRLDTLIFTVPAVDFPSLNAGDDVVLYHGQVPPTGMSPGETDGWSVWVFPPFDPSLLDCLSDPS